MSKTPSKRFGILLTTSLFIILAMSMYYIYTQNVKETKVKKRAFKVLYRYASDLAEKEKDIRAQYNGPIRIELSAINKAIERKRNDQNQRNIIQRDINSLWFELKREKSKNVRSEIKSTIKVKSESYQNISKDIEELLKRKELLESTFQRNESPNIEAEAWYSLNGIKYDTTDTSWLKIRKEQLFDNVFGTQMFEHFVVFDQENIVYKTLEALNDLQMVLDKKNGFIPDSLKAKNGAFTFTKDFKLGGHNITNPSENQMKITISGEEYQAFIIPIQSVGMSHLVGLVANNKYSSMKRGFDRGLISAISIFIVLFLLSVPVVKLMVVTPGEAFTIKSLITLLFSGAGLFFMVMFFSLYIGNTVFMRSHIAGKDGHLHKISDSIKKAFDDEMNAMLAQLDTFTEVLSSPYLLQGTGIDDANLLTSGDRFNALDTTYAKLQRKIKNRIISKIDSGPYPSWLEAFTASTVDKKTVFVVENTKKWKESPTGIDISKRDYIQNTKRFHKNGEYFGFQSIFSLNTALPQVVISQKVKGLDHAVCISAEMHTVNDVILPYGYSFCIIDKTGKVWFHENPRNNLRENLFEETDHYPLLEAAVKSRRSNTITCDYKMKSNIMRITPLDADMGLFLVSMCDVNDYYQIFHQSGYMILGSILVIFSLWFVFALIYRWYQKMRNSSRYQAHSLLYFFPNKKYSEKYLRLIYTNILFVILFIIVTLLLYQQIYVNHWVRLITLTGASLLLWNMREVRSRITTYSFLALLKLTLLEVFFFYLFEYMLNGAFLTKSTCLSIALLIGFNALLYMVLRLSLTRISTEVRCFKVYFYYIFSLAIATIFVPLFTVFNVVYNQEIIMHDMHQQRYVADKLIEREIRFAQNHKQTSIDELTSRGNYFQNLHCMSHRFTNKTNSNDTVNTHKVDSSKMQVTSNYIEVFGDVRSALYFINNKIEDRGNLVKPNYSSSTDSFYEYSIKDDLLILNVNSGGYPYYDRNVTLQMDKLVVHDLAKRYKGFIIGLVLVFILFAVFFPKIANYLFPQYKYGRKLFDDHESICLPKSGDKRYLVSLPDKVLFKECLYSENAVLINMDDIVHKSNIKAYTDERKDIYLFIEEKSFENLLTLKVLVLGLEQIIYKKSYRSIAIVCFKTPTVLIGEIRQWLIKTCDAHSLELDTLLNRLQNLISGFSLSYLPLMLQPISKDYNNKPFEGKLAWLNQEVGCNAFLLSQHEALKVMEESFVVNKREGVVDDINVYVVYVTLRNYYQRLWDHCTPEEKSVLFDISEDHMINMHKEGVVNELINKGLVLKGSYLSLFNLSFTHFVLHQRQEVILINSLLRDEHKSGWSQYNLPIKLLAAAILIFLFVTQQEFLSGLQSLLISVGAIFTVAVRFFNNPFKSGGNIVP